MPFVRNVQTDQTISRLFEDLQTAIKELQVDLPHDPTVMRWVTMFGRDTGDEWTRYQAQSG